MSPHRQIPMPLYWLLFALCILPGLSVVASISWLQQQPKDLALLLTGIAGAVTVIAALTLGIIHDRGMDEWERSNARFSSFWGEAIGTSLVALMLAIAPVRDAIVSAVGNWAGAADPDQKLVIIAFTCGFVIVVLAKTLCMAFLSVGWTYWKSRGVRDAA